MFVHALSFYNEIVFFLVTYIFVWYVMPCYLSNFLDLVGYIHNTVLYYIVLYRVSKSFVVKPYEIYSQLNYYCQSIGSIVLSYVIALLTGKLRLKP